MVEVLPGTDVMQHAEDVVVYRLPFAEWSQSLERPDDKQAVFSVRVLKGQTTLQMAVLPYQAGQPCNLVRVTGGSSNGRYEVVRIVRAANGEMRRRSFIVKVI